MQEINEICDRDTETRQVLASWYFALYTAASAVVDRPASRRLLRRLQRLRSRLVPLRQGATQRNQEEEPSAWRRPDPRRQQSGPRATETGFRGR